MLHVHITGTIEAAAPSGQIFPMGLRKSLGRRAKRWKGFQLVNEKSSCYSFLIFCIGESWQFIYEHEWCMFKCYLQLEKAIEMLRVQSDRMLVEGFHQRLVIVCSTIQWFFFYRMKSGPQENALALSKCHGTVRRRNA